jgi:maleylacetoacetate isomerase/maleylpyruvate isomerase
VAITLYSYWRSTAAYRVRLALNLKGLEYRVVAVSLLPGVSEHRQDAYRQRNPQMLIPFIEDGDFSSGQSQAILEYLEEAYPEPALLPQSKKERAAIRSFCNSICCDVHPLNNLRVLVYLKETLGVSDEQRDAWYAHWIHEGFRAAEIMAGQHGGPFVFGARITLADVCLVPQIYNARRFKVALDDYPNLVAVDAHCRKLEAFDAAAPDNQPDAD